MLIHIRQDLRFYQRPSKSGPQWVVKDPVGFNHFLFSEEEVFLLKLFDGSRTLEQIRESWQTEFRTRSLTMPQLKSIVRRFLTDNLLIADRFGDGKRLRKERQTLASRQFWVSLTSPYVFRLGRIDPAIALDALKAPARLLFHPIAVLVNLALAVFVLLFFIGHFENISQRANLMSSFFSYKNMVIVTLVIVGVKILHELGHALACRKYGGECFEIGLLFIAFFPTLYCDVSDSWTFKEKWKRILVSFAGIYIEIILATIGAILWLTTNPGLANTVFFNIAVMCSINTLLINGNPLLKYDGYYVVSDFFDQPNLASRSRKQLRRFFENLLSEAPTSTKVNFWLCLYGILSSLYRIFVVVVILAGLSLLMKSLSFGRLGNVITFALLALMLSRNSPSKFFQAKSDLNKGIHRLRSAVTLGCLGLLLCGFLFVKLPSSVYCQFVVEPTCSSVAYAPRNGILKLRANAYDQVQSGQCVGKIIDDRLNEQLDYTISELVNLNQRLKLAIKLQSESPQAASEVEQLRNQIKKTQSHLDALEEEKCGLTLSTDQKGIIRPIAFENGEAKSASQTNGAFFGNVFDAENSDLLVHRGQPLFAIEGNELSLIARLDETSIEQLEIGQKAVLKFERQPSRTFKGAVSKIIETESFDQKTADIPSADEQANLAHHHQKPEFSGYRVVLSASGLPPAIVSGSTGRVRILVSPSTAFEKLLFIANQWWQ